MQKSLKRGIAASCLLTLLLNLTACGYFLYPERKGQTGGRVDPVVVILDGAALLFGILPGLVAFAVDFTNGTIYLPAGGSSAIDRHISASEPLPEGEEVLDQNGQAWIKYSIESFSTEAENLPQLRAALANYSGQEITLGEIVWIEDLAALQTLRAQAFSTAQR